MPRTRSQTDAFAPLLEVDCIRLDYPKAILTRRQPRSALQRHANFPEAAQPRREAVITTTKYIGSTGTSHEKCDHDGYFDGGEPLSLSADVSYAEADFGDGPRKGLVIKVIDYMSMPRTRSSRIKHEFECEAYNFELAKDAQGSALPRFGGYFTDGGLQCLVFEDAGKRLNNDDYKSRVVLEEALSALRTVQATGVSPGIHDRGSLCRGSDGRIKITTLWQAATRDRFAETVERFVEHSQLQSMESDEETLRKLNEMNLAKLYRKFQC